MTEKIFEIIKSRESEYKAFLRDMVNIESYSFDKTDVDRLGRFIKEFAESKGFNVKVCPFEKAGNGLVITMNENAALPPVVFTAHMDTVHPKGRFTPPFFREEDGVLYGPGVIDCKGGIAIALFAMASLKEAGFTARPVKLIAVSDEEIDQRLSGKAGGDFIRDNSKGAAAALTLENNPNPGYLIISRKGSIRFKVNVHGKAATASERKKDGINAIMEAAYKIIEMENTAPQSDDIIFNCGLVSGGVAENMVPAEANFVVAVKYKLKSQRQAVIDHVEKIVNKTFVPGAHSDYEIIAERPSMIETAANRGLGEYVSEISQKYGWGEILPYRASAGTDAAYTTDAGVPSVCGLGATGINGHTVNELMYADSLVKRAKLAAACVFDMPEDFCAEKYDKQG